MAVMRQRAEISQWGGPLLIALFLTCAVGVVHLQEDSTNRHPQSFDYFERFMSCDLSPIFNARVLSRQLVLFVHRCTMGSLTLKESNMLFQMLVMWASLIFVYSFASVYLKPSRALIAPLLMTIFTTWGFLYMGLSLSYPYDLPSLFFNTVGLWCVAKRRFTPLCVVMALGMLNKESIVWLAFAHLFFNLGEKKWSSLLLEFASLLLLCALAYFPSRHIAGSSNINITVSSNDGTNARWIVNIQELLFINRPTKILQYVHWPLMIHFIPLAFYKQLPIALRRMYWGTIFFIVPTMIFGNLFEVRQFNDILPLGAVACAYIIHRRLETEIPENTEMSTKERSDCE